MTSPRLLAFLDYDATLTTHECDEIVLQHLVGDARLELEEESYSDRMSHAECFDRQIELIGAPRAELIRRLLASELIGGGPAEGPPYRLEFSDALGDCPRCGPKSCKAAVLRRLRRPGDVVLVVGDGPSDLCPAREADVVFARGHLIERCEAEGLEWRPLTDFGAVIAQVDEWLESRGAERGGEAGR